ncbi:MAG: M23 family metallopeptidase [Clostridia bacterium]|nr:M23 family metallopeptidase [Clostridia bacterium]
MEKKKKFSKANLLYVFSMALGLTIIVVGFSVANSARKELDKQNQVQQISEKNQEEKQVSETVSKTAEKIEKKEIPTETVVLTAAETTDSDEFAPNLEDYVIALPTAGDISRAYTGKSLVYSDYFDDWRVHKGVDISSNELSQVRAAANGRVKSVYKHNALGIVIELQHGDFITKYGNLSTDKLVKTGDEVKAGDVISGVGKSKDGKTYLHFEIEYKGEDIDPEPLLVR